TTTQNEKIVLNYTTSNGKTISSEDINTPSNVLEPANLQLRLATVSNQGGLKSEGSNNYTVGNNAGITTYGLGQSSTIGTLASGGLEASNVDLSKELSNMILAQSAIQANSRTFTTMSQIMQTLVSLGR
ncbi:MAG: flagellar basal body rod C-terminal domain-containing protein, partial [Candidatus Gastranaerophilaceae bacterium]